MALALGHLTLAQLYVTALFEGSLAGVLAQQVGAPLMVVLRGGVLLALALACMLSPALRGVKRLG